MVALHAKHGFVLQYGSHIMNSVLFEDVGAAEAPSTGQAAGVPLVGDHV